MRGVDGRLRQANASGDARGLRDGALDQQAGDSFAHRVAVDAGRGGQLGNGGGIAVLADEGPDQDQRLGLDRRDRFTQRHGGGPRWLA